jgi:MFS family permease
MSRPLLAHGAFYTAGVQLSNVSVVLPFVCAQRGFGWIAGFLLPVFSVGTIVGNSMSPAILQWCRQRKHLVLAATSLIMALLVACNAMMAATDHSAAVLMLATTAAIGVMAGISSVSFSDVVCTALPGTQRGRLLLTQGAAGSVLATTTTIALAPLLLRSNSPAAHVHVLWLGVFGLVIAAGVALFLGPARPEPATTGPRTSLLSTYRSGLSIARSQTWFRQYAITHLLFVPVVLGTTFHSLRAADGDVSLHVLVVVSSVGLVAGSALWRPVFRRHGVRGMLCGSALLSSLATVGSMVGEIVAGTANVWLQTAIILLATMAGQAVFAAAITWISTFADEHHRATLIAFAAAMVALTTATVGAVMGMVAQIQTPVWPVAVVLVLNVAAGCVATRAPGASLSPVEPRKNFCQKAIGGDVDLVSGRQVLHSDGAGLDVAVTGDQGERSTGTVGRAHRAFDATVTVGEVDAHTSGTQPRRQHGQRDLGLLAEWHSEHVDTSGATDRLALGLQRQHRPVHA